MESILWVIYLAFAGGAAVLAFLIFGTVALISPGLLFIVWGYSLNGITGGLVMLIGIAWIGFFISLAVYGSKPSGQWIKNCR